MKTLFAAALAFSMLSGVAQAHEFKAGDLAIHHPWAKATLPSQPVGGGFMEIVNTGSEPDRLVSGKAAFAGDLQIHEMATQDGIMKMRQLPDGIEIPAGGTVKLEPGGLHIMFMKLSEPLKEGEMKEATLTFEKAGDVVVEFSVESAKPNAAKTDHSKMDHSGM
jgi:periplasmic copper chaperone A